MMKKLENLEIEHENFVAVKYRMENEGIDYCFEHYSSWDEIQDEEFHKLRLEFLDSMKKIRDYVGTKIENLSGQIDDSVWGDY